MMRDLQQELNRKLLQELCRQGLTLDIERRLFGEAKQQFVATTMRSGDVAHFCEHSGARYRPFEWMMGRQEERVDVPKLDPAAHWIIDDEWAALEPNLLRALRDLDEQEPLHMHLETFMNDALSSYDGQLLREMRAWRFADISVDRVGAHLLAMGHRWSDDQAAALTRRFTISLLNYATRGKG